MIGADAVPRLSYPPSPEGAEIARALRGRRSGRGWLARCPAHDDHNPSLSISVGNDGRTLVHCHAGCSQDQVLTALKDRGLWHYEDRDTRPRLKIVDTNSNRDESRIEYARSIWNSVFDPKRTLQNTVCAELFFAPFGRLTTHTVL